MADKKAGDANAFIQEYGPIAEKIGKELDVDPRIILAKFGVETGWGEKVIPGTYNLGNIKSASGRGAKAKDNATKTVDSYLRFEDPDVFADYYVDYMKRQFPKAIGAGSDVGAFASGLQPGERGGYAEDKDYGSKLSNAFSLVNARVGNQYDKSFGVGEPTEAQRISEEPEPPELESAAVTSSDDAAMIGAGAGLLAGQVAKNTKIPTSARYDSAMERLNRARDKLNEVQKRVGSGSQLPQLEQEFKSAQSAYRAAESEFAKASEELKSARGSTVAPAAPPREPGAIPEPDQHARGIQGTVKDTGITGRASQTTYNERTAQIARNERAQRAALQQLQRQGLIDPAKAYQLTEGISASTPSGVLVPPGEASARRAKLEAELAPFEKKVEEARFSRQTAGETRRAANQALSQARRGQQEAGRAQEGVRVAEKALERTPSGPQGVLQKTGAATARVAPRALGVISGAATGMAAMEAIDRFKKGDYTGAVLPTIEATFGVMSMLPPAHPILLALRGLGTAGGAALMGYEGYKAIRD